MVNKKLAMLAWFQSRNNTEPRFCALLPGYSNDDDIAFNIGIESTMSNEVESNPTFEKQPDCLRIIYLPFQEDVRREVTHRVNDVKNGVQNDAKVTLKTWSKILEEIQIKNYHPCDVSN